jgi:hypothetical protein
VRARRETAGRARENPRLDPNFVSEVQACVGGCWARAVRVDFHAVLPME